MVPWCPEKVCLGFKSELDISASNFKKLIIFKYSVSKNLTKFRKIVFFVCLFNKKFGAELFNFYFLKILTNRI